MPSTIKIHDCLIPQAKDGSKTHTRRPTDKGWKVGDVLTVLNQDKVDQGFAVEITSVHKEKLQDISYLDANKEGIKGFFIYDEWVFVDYLDKRDFLLDDIESFKSLWEKFYQDTNYQWSNNPSVFVYGFKKV